MSDVVLPELDLDGDSDLLPEVFDAMLEKARENRDYVMRLKEQSRIDPAILEIIRDTFIAGEDVDAIAILSTELGLMPRESVEQMDAYQKREIAWDAWWEAFRRYGNEQTDANKIMVRDLFDKWWNTKQDELRQLFNEMVARNAWKARNNG